MRRFGLILCSVLMMAGPFAAALCLSGCGGTGNQPEPTELDPQFGQAIREVGAPSRMQEERAQERAELEAQGSISGGAAPQQ